MSTHDEDVAFGACPSGYAAAIRAAQPGKTIQPCSRAACIAPRPGRCSAAIDTSTRP
ncbi:MULTISPECIES: hypothetical protein [unclassified Streptomyces]|uniref:hypothetical protein n=1 Tax=unclassified Streptomyces TaxID=2593676 RepID=UPI002E806B23|nr:hypothetical protein [Streptomyces sp. NBC_00589]WTI41447.1 hypothetical protein OIC96_43830 [Streptomyces sp. NBC_00775]WUB24869.1 hypothetical protein OHA51_05895 [Streptomyces sp. NBC_00589]